MKEFLLEGTSGSNFVVKRLRGKDEGGVGELDDIKRCIGNRGRLDDIMRNSDEQTLGTSRRKGASHIKRTQGGP